MKKRTLVPALLAIYNARWNEYHWGSYTWRIAFGCNCAGSPLPMEAGTRLLQDDSGTLMITIHLAGPNRKGVRKHRVTVVCPRCKNHVFAGRIHQHTCEEV
jgi:hypothetical protein